MTTFVDESEPDWDIDIPFEIQDIQIKRDHWVTQDFEIKDVFLGSGKFGEVKECVDKSSGQRLAAKFIATYEEDDRQTVLNEIEMMKRLQHPRLLQLIDAFDGYKRKKEMCLVLELIEGGELFERVVDDDFVLTERAVIMFMKQIVDGVKYIHSQHVLHLDLKPENILCLTKTGNAVKIIDFGLAKHYDGKKELFVLAGTPEFVAPEIITYEGCSESTDWWSVGVICYVLLSGLSPFMGDSDMDTLQNVTSCDWTFDYKEFEKISDSAKDFVSKLLILQPKKRMSGENCWNHEWLKTHDGCANLKLNKARLKRFVIRRKWQKAVNAIVALQRMGVNLSTSNIGTPATNDTSNSSTIAPENVTSLKDVTSESEVTSNEMPTSGNVTSNSCEVNATQPTVALEKATSPVKVKDPTAPEKVTPPVKMKDPTAPEKVTSKEKVKDPTAPQKMTSQEKVKDPTAPEKVTSPSKLNDPTAPEKVTSQEKVKDPTAPRKVTSQEKVKDPTAPQKVTSQEKVNDPTAPEKVTSPSKLKDPTAPEKVTSQEKVKDPTASEKVTSREKVKDPTAPEKMTSQEKLKDLTVSEKLTSPGKGKDPTDPERVTSLERVSKLADPTTSEKVSSPEKVSMLADPTTSEKVTSRYKVKLADPTTSEKVSSPEKVSMLADPTTSEKVSSPEKVSMLADPTTSEKVSSPEKVSMLADPTTSEKMTSRYKVKLAEPTAPEKVTSPSKLRSTNPTIAEKISLLTRVKPLNPTRRNDGIIRIDIMK